MFVSLLLKIKFWKKKFAGISPSLCPCDRGTMDSNSWCWHRSACLCSSWGHSQRNWALCRIQLLRGHPLPSARTFNCKSECLDGLWMKSVGYFDLSFWVYLFWFTILCSVWIIFYLVAFLIVEAKKSICSLVVVGLICIGIDGYSWKEYVFVGLATGLK